MVYLHKPNQRFHWCLGTCDSAAFRRQRTKPEGYYWDDGCHHNSCAAQHVGRRGTLEYEEAITRMVGVSSIQIIDGLILGAGLVY